MDHHHERTSVGAFLRAWRRGDHCDQHPRVPAFLHASQDVQLALGDLLARDDAAAQCLGLFPVDQVRDVAFPRDRPVVRYAHPAVQNDRRGGPLVPDDVAVHCLSDHHANCSRDAGARHHPTAFHYGHGRRGLSHHDPNPDVQSGLWSCWKAWGGRPMGDGR